MGFWLSGQTIALTMCENKDLDIHKSIVGVNCFLPNKKGQYLFECCNPSKVQEMKLLILSPLTSKTKN